MKNPKCLEMFYLVLDSWLAPIIQQHFSGDLICCNGLHNSETNACLEHLKNNRTFGTIWCIRKW